MQLLQVERGWRDMKSLLDLRPVYHRLETASAPTSCSAGPHYCSCASPKPPPGRTGPTIRAELQRLQAITYTGAAGAAVETTESTKTQRDLLTALALDPPKRILELTPAPTAPTP
jgi:hypothetical protein